MRTGIWLVLALVVAGLIGVLADWRLQRFMAVELPVPSTTGSKLQRPPLEECRRGRVDLSRPPAQSFIEEAKVYNAVLIYLFFGGGAEQYLQPSGFPSSLHLLMRTADPWSRDSFRATGADSQPMNFVCAAFPQLALSTVRSFRYLNLYSRPLLNWFTAPAPVRLIDVPPREGGWSRFFAVNPGANGTTAFSRVGFSDDYSQALAFVEHLCGDGCGEGSFLLLHRSGGQWKVVGRRGAWIT